MDLFAILSKYSWQDIEHLLRQYEALGPLPGVLITMIESFLPVLPLVAIVVANVNAYGLLKGILISWIGVIVGSMGLFLIVRRLSGHLRQFIMRRLSRTQKLIYWLERNGFTPIFLLSCFPFSPAFLVNIVSGISKLPIRTFFIATAVGKGIMIAFVSYAGHDIETLIFKPWKVFLLIVVFVLMWIFTRKLEAKYFK